MACLSSCLRVTLRLAPQVASSTRRCSTRSRRKCMRVRCSSRAWECLPSGPRAGRAQPCAVRTQSAHTVAQQSWSDQSATLVGDCKAAVLSTRALLRVLIGTMGACSTLRCARIRRQRPSRAKRPVAPDLAHEPHSSNAICRASAKRIQASCSGRRADFGTGRRRLRRA